MKKSGLLSRLAHLKARAELEPDDGSVGLEVVDTLLDYINDPNIREAVEAIPFVEVRDDSGNKESARMSGG